MVARLFRAVAAMDERMTRGQHRVHRKIKRLQDREVTNSALASSQTKVETRIMAAAQQLKTVLQVEILECLLLFGCELP